MASLLVRVVSVLGGAALAVPLEVRLRYEATDAAGSSVDAIGITTSGEAHFDLPKGAAISEITVLDQFTQAVMSTTGQEFGEIEGSDVVTLFVSPPERLFTVALLDKESGQPNAEPLDVTMWYSSRMHMVTHAPENIRGAVDIATFSMPADVVVERITAAGADGKLVVLEPVDELNAMVKHGALRFVVGSATSPHADDVLYDIDFDSVFRLAAFDNPRASGKHPDDLDHPPSLDGYLAVQTAYESLRSLGRIDYVLLWDSRLVGWHTSDDQWVVPVRPRAEDDEPLAAVRGRVAAVLELGIGRASALRTPPI
jgi:hypothetical protein